MLIFGRPLLAQLAPLLVLLAAVGWWRLARRRRRLGDSFGGREASRRLTGRDLYRAPLARAVLACAALLALCLALAEPGWREAARAPPPPLPPREIVLAVDISRSMQAPDVEPTRLAQAREVVARLVEADPDGRFGLLLFAGQTYSLTPPTADDAAVLPFFLAGLAPDLVSELDPGSLLSAALREGVRLLEPTDSADRAIVLLTDGESHEPEAAVLRAAEETRARGIRVFAVGVGTERGAGLVQPDRMGQWGGTVRDEGGAEVVARLRAPLLRRVAEAGGGVYAAAADPGAMAELRTALVPMVPEAPPTEPVSFWRRVDPGFLLAAAALGLLFVESLGQIRSPRRVPAGARRLA